MKLTIESLTRQSERLSNQLDKDLMDTPSSERSSVFSYHGGWSHGYLEGRISAIDDIIDILRDQEDSQ